jgi:hypothetical protein
VYATFDTEAAACSLRQYVAQIHKSKQQSIGTVATAQQQVVLL